MGESSFHSLLVELGVRGSTSLGDAYALADSLGLARTPDEWSSLLAELASCPWPAVVHGASATSPQPTGKTPFIDDSSELRASDELVRHVLRVPPSVDAGTFRVLRAVAAARSAGVSMTELHGFVSKEAPPALHAKMLADQKASCARTVKFLEDRCVGSFRRQRARAPEHRTSRVTCTHTHTHTHTHNARTHARARSAPPSNES
jgi:hypothetical protein